MTPDQAKILAQIEQKLDDLCQHNANEHKELKSTINDIYKKVDEDKTEVYRALNNRPRWNVIMWLLGGVFASLIIIGSFMYDIDNKIEKHISAGEKIYLQDTGKIIDLRGDK